MSVTLIGKVKLSRSVLKLLPFGSRVDCEATPGCRRSWEVGEQDGHDYLAWACGHHR